MAKAMDGCDVFLVNEKHVRRVEKEMPDALTVQRVADIFATLADPTRAKIVFALAKAELCVCDLAALLGMTLSAVSHQLRVLRHLGLVKYRKDGRMAYYSLDDAHANALLTQALDHVRHEQTAPARRVSGLARKRAASHA